MEMLIDPTTGDYAGNTSDNLANAVYLRLRTPLGSWWADPKLGSLLHTLQRDKDLPRVRTLARQYAEQALQPVIDDGRALSVVVSAEPYRQGWLLLVITVTSASGESQPFRHPVKVI